MLGREHGEEGVTHLASCASHEDGTVRAWTLLFRLGFRHCELAHRALREMVVLRETGGEYRVYGMQERAIPLPPRAESAEAIIRLLDLAPHPEGGFYRETWRHAPSDGGRGAGTAIYFLLPHGVENRWHRVDASEIWHFYAGSPLELSIEEEGQPAWTRVLGTAFLDGERPQIEVPAGVWQRARSLGPWTLVGCTVSPAFLFERFHIRD
jgi:hypothetical protein